MKSLINEYDITKMMIEKINESKLIGEQEETEDSNERPDNTGANNKEEVRKLAEFLGTADIRDNTINVDNENGKATWNGIINGIINFTINAGGNPNDKLIIKMDGVSVDKEVADIITKLEKYSENWVNDILSQSGDLG
jgi:hypothetical protein